MRIHIGRISPSLAEHKEELEQRLDRYGLRTSPLLLRRKEFGSFYFAFVEMDIDKKQYGALCTALNGVQFRQSRLEIKQAEPSYFERMKFGQSTPQLKIQNADQLKRERSRPRRKIDVLPGRMREAERKNTEQTFRIKIKGELRKPKMRKTKLWGIEKRPLAKLSNHFVDREWRDSEDKTIEVVTSMLDEHAEARKVAENLSQSAGYLSDSDFEVFKETAQYIGETLSDEEMEIVSKDSKALSKQTMEVSEGDEPIKSNTTESLRSALIVEAPFTLFGGPTETIEKQEVPIFPQIETRTESEPKNGLFFAHSDSPYLRSQSQVSKLVDKFDGKAWETEFFEKRGEWNRDLRNRRHEAARMARRMGKKKGET